VTAQEAPERLQPPAGPAHPVAQRGAVELDPLPGEDRRLPIEGQMITELGHQHVREQGFRRHPARDRPFRSGCLHHGLFTGPAGVAGSADHLHPQLRRHEVEHLARVFADRVQRPAAAGAALVLDVDQHLDPRQVRRQAAQVASTGPRRPRSIATPRSGLLRRLGGRCRLLEVLQAELRLVGVELFRAAAKLPTLQPPDQEPQLLDLGLRRVTLLANEVALSTSGIPLDQNSIVLDLEGSYPGALDGNDFSHMP
jgi:hypothetical protein